MKKSKSLITLSISLALVGGAAAGFLGSTSGVKANAESENGNITIYLDTFESNWDSDGAKFGVYYWEEGKSGQFLDGFLEPAKTENEFEKLYSAEIPDTAYGVIFTRHKSDVVSPTWENAWNQTYDIILSDMKSNNCVNVTVADPNDPDGYYYLHKTRLFEDVADGAYYVCPETEWKKHPDYALDYDETKEEYSGGFVCLTDNEFKLLTSYRGSNLTWYGWGNVDEGSVEHPTARRYNQWSQGATNDNIHICKDGIYTLYLKVGSSVKDAKRIWCNPANQDVSVTITKDGESTTKDLKPTSTVGVYETQKDISTLCGSKIEFTVEGVAVADINIAQDSRNDLWKSSDGEVLTCLDNTAKFQFDVRTNTVSYLLDMEKPEDKCFGLSVNNKYVALTPIEAESGYDRYEVNGLEINPGDEFKFVNCSSDKPNVEVFQIVSTGGIPEEEEFRNQFTLDQGEGKLTYYGEETVKIYVVCKVKPDRVSLDNEFWFRKIDSAAEDAIQFAKTFKECFEPICASPDFEQINNAWTSMTTPYGDLTEAAREIIQKVQESHPDENLAYFAHQYDYIYQKYGDKLAEGNWASRDVEFIPGRDVIDKFDSTALIAITVSVALVAATSIAVLAIAKKRKEN